MSNDENHLGNVLAGMGLGAVLGAGIGLGVCVYLFEDPLWFTGDTVLFGALLCGALGFFLGEGCIEWLKEHALESWRWWW